MTRAQLKFASASAAFLNHGGLAITALGRMLFLLLPAVLSEGIHRIFVALDRWFIQHSPKSEPKKEVEAWTANARS